MTEPKWQQWVLALLNIALYGSMVMLIVLSILLLIGEVAP